jgi:hypothetical protein
LQKLVDLQLDVLHRCDWIICGIDEEQRILEDLRVEPGFLQTCDAIMCRARSLQKQLFSSPKPATSRKRLPLGGLAGDNADLAAVQSADCKYEPLPPREVVAALSIKAGHENGEICNKGPNDCKRRKL